MSEHIDEPPTWQHERAISHSMITDSLISVAQWTVDDLKKSFDEARVENGWPATARPIWYVRWTYTAETEMRVGP